MLFGAFTFSWYGTNFASAFLRSFWDILWADLMVVAGRESTFRGVGPSPPFPHVGSVSNHLVWYRTGLRCSAARKTLNDVVMTMRL